MKTICRVLTGPTASGKSDLALSIAAKHGLEILCMDSMQIYRGMDIGTAKPGEIERNIVPHHLLDICDPRDSFSVSDYREKAETLVMSLAKKGKEVLFVGGTGLYLQAMAHPMSMGNVSADEGLREELNALAQAPGGKEILHRMLAELDPDTARRLPVNDIRRTIRAIEVSRLTGIPFSKQPMREEPSMFEWRIVSTNMSRDILYERINSRVGRMVDQGLPDEVGNLLRSGVPENAQSMAGIGYKEMIPYIKGTRTLEQAIDDIRLATRHYAKRQMTFQKREPATRYLNVCEPYAEKQLEEMLAI